MGRKERRELSVTKAIENAVSRLEGGDYRDKIEERIQKSIEASIDALVLKHLGVEDRFCRLELDGKSPLHAPLDKLVEKVATKILEDDIEISKLTQNVIDDITLGDLGEYFQENFVESMYEAAHKVLQDEAERMVKDILEGEATAEEVADRATAFGNRLQIFKRAAKILALG